MATVEEREKKVELSLSDRFQGGFCGFYNVPLPSNDNCLFCEHGRIGLDGKSGCRLGVRLD